MKNAVSDYFFWENSGWETEDPQLIRLNEMPFQRAFPEMPSKPGLYIIRGPRQIGKSSWLKKILSKHAKDKRCFYMSCENILDHKELSEILTSQYDREVVLLDEINFVKNWDRAIKHNVDHHKPRIVVLTGSHAADLKQGIDSMPGRFGAGGESFLLPMLFDEFQEARKQAGWSSASRVEELECFFRVGGFPLAVAEAGQKAKTPSKAMKTYWKWLLGDIQSLGKDEDYLTEVLVQLLLCQQNPVSLQTLAKKTSIGSHHTIKEYLSALESCFALRPLLAIDKDTNSYKFKKNKKYYFADPLIYWIVKNLLGQKANDDDYGQLAEMVAHEQLYRSNKRFGYLGTPKGEIDFYAPKQWAIEVKWAQLPCNLSRAYLDANLPSKKVWTKQNFLN